MRAPRVRVVIDSADDEDVWSTVGVSKNIIEASWLALVDSVEYKLFKDLGEAAVSGAADAVLGDADVSREPQPQSKA
jgi:hypothetical protein